MNKFIILTIILCIFFILLYINRQNSRNNYIEGLTNINSPEPTPKPILKPEPKANNLNKQKTQGATSFIGNNRTQQLDELYENTTTYENEVGREGLDICLEKCRGNCVEYGMHGKAFCFETK